jgi:hypothetical protein
MVGLYSLWLRDRPDKLRRAVNPVACVFIIVAGDAVDMSALHRGTT